MQIKKDMVLQKVAGMYAVVPTESALQDFNGIAFLNKTGCDIWNGIEAGQTAQEIAQALTEKYDGVTAQEAFRCVQQLIDKLAAEGLIEP